MVGVSMKRLCLMKKTSRSKKILLAKLINSFLKYLQTGMPLKLTRMPTELWTDRQSSSMLTMKNPFANAVKWLSQLRIICTVSAQITLNSENWDPVSLYSSNSWNICATSCLSSPSFISYHVLIWSTRLGRTSKIRISNMMIISSHYSLSVPCFTKRIKQIKRVFTCSPWLLLFQCL